MENDQNSHSSNISSGHNVDNIEIISDGVSIKIDNASLTSNVDDASPISRIDDCVFSPDGSYLATYSSEEGGIEIWKYDKDSDDFQLSPVHLKPLKPRKYAQNVDFALCNDGNKI